MEGPQREKRDAGRRRPSREEPEESEPSIVAGWSDVLGPPCRRGVPLDPVRSVLLRGPGLLCSGHVRLLVEPSLSLLQGL